ncbi:ABC transporter permease [Gaopeijia maritima]
MDGIWTDVRWAARSLLRSPGFALVAVSSLALGIGANTAIFTLVNAVLLRPLPVSEPDRLFDVYTVDGSNADRNLIPVSIPNFLDLDQGLESFAGVAAEFSGGFSLEPDDGGEAAGVPGSVVTGDYFELLGVDAAAGRLLRSSDEGPRGTGAVAVLSHALWTNRFGADPAVVGRTVRLNGIAFEVVGVAPAGFRGRRTLAAPERVWVPFSMLYDMTPPGLHTFFEARRALPIEIFGRLADGVSPATARAELDVWARRLEAEYPDANRDRSLALVSMAQAAVGVNQRDTLTRSGAAGMVVVGLILLIACANLANLLLSRAAGRSRELALRAALGADRWALVRRSLSESLLLAVVGGAIGLAIAGWGSRLMLSLGSELLPAGAVEPALEGRVLAFTAVLAIGTGLLFGLVPAVRAARTDIVGLLKEGGRQGAGLARSPLRSGLVVAEVALAMVGLTGAGLLVRSMQAAATTPLGYAVEGLAVVGVPVGGASPAESIESMRRARSEVLAVQGVEAAGFGGVVPLTEVQVRTFLPEGAPPDRASSFVSVVAAMPDYLPTLGVAPESGRGVIADDLLEGAPAVAVVNRALADRYWPGENPLGRRFTFYGDPVVREVVGVVPTVTITQTGEEPRPAAYMPWSQWPQGFGVLHLRTSGGGAAVLGAVAERLRALHPEATLQPPRTVDDLRYDTLRARRVGAGLVGAFALVALVLAVMGIHAVLATVSRQRTHEIGVRMALGARRGAVLRMVVGQGMALVGVGVGVGLLASVVAGRLVQSLLFDTSPSDPVTLLVVPVVLSAVALLACLGPAWRSTRTSPVRALSPERSGPH